MSMHRFDPGAGRRRSGVLERSLRQHMLAHTVLTGLALGVMLVGPAHAGFAAREIRPSSVRVTPNPKPVLALPKLSTEGVKTAFPLYQHCDDKGPIVIASIYIRNTGGPLAAGKGHIYASEDSGVTDGHKRMVSPGMPLGAINANASELVSVPISSLAPYSELVGTHQLTVHWTALTEAGKQSFVPPPPTYHFSVTIPKGFCSPKVIRRRAPTSTIRLKLNPQPKPPLLRR